MTTSALSYPAGIQQPEDTAKLEFAPWTPWQRFLFRVALIFIALATLPFHAQFFQRLVGISSLHDVYAVGMIGSGIRYVTLRGESARWGALSFINWYIDLGVVIALAAVWTWFARNSKRKEYTVAYYWLRLWTRYWIAMNVLHYAYLKVWPAQMPFPSIANQHTLVGEIAPYKFYWTIVGLSTWYQVVLGCCEATAGSLLFFRRTTALGAILNLGMLYNVAHANFAYDGSVHTLSVEVAVLSAFLLVQYVPDMYRLLVKKQDVAPLYYHPEFKNLWARYGFDTLKYALWIFLIPLYCYNVIHHYVYTNQSKEPRAPGLSNAKGYYAVTEFQLNGKDLPYSPLDPVRWQDVTFENWPTLTFKVDKPLPIRLENAGQLMRDIDKTYEMAGFAGGRTYMAYDLDEANQTLTVQDRNNTVITRDPSVSAANRARSNGDGQGNNDAPNRRRNRGHGNGPQKLVWHYTRPTPDRIILTGQLADKQKFYAVLDRIHENQAIHVGSPLPGQPLQYDRLFTRRYPVTPKSFDGTTDSTIHDFDN